MNSLDQALDSFAREVPSPAMVQEAQRRLEGVLASRRDVATSRSRRHVTGWLAAAASFIAVVTAVVWLPFASAPVSAFEVVQRHFRDFERLRFEIVQRVNGEVLMTARVAVLANGSVRTETGDVVVVVNTAERRVLTLLESQRLAMVSPLDGPVTREDAMSWLQEVRDFQGMAKELPGSRLIRGQRARGWELPMEQGSITLWADGNGLPLEMQVGQGVAMDLSFQFEFEPPLPADLFSTAVPAGYTLHAGEED